MNLIFIYGPPAAGKLTVAIELSKLTGYKIFHNHLTRDLVRSLFKGRSDIGNQYIDKYRFELMEAAAKHKIDFIFTYVYEKDVDDNFVAKTIKLVEKHHGKVCFVQLKCNEAQLKKRVNAESRKKFTKLRKVSKLKELLKQYDWNASIPHRKSLVIDNTKISAKNAAKKIQTHYKL